MTGVLPPTAENAYGYYGRIDHVLQAVERGPSGVIRTGDELIAPYTSTEFHTDWVRPNEIDEGIFVRLTNAPNPVSFIVAGSKWSRPYTEERVSLFRELVPHLQQSLSAQQHLSTFRERAQNFAEAADRLSHGIVIITKERRIVDCNAAAQRMLSERDGLSVSNGALVASMPSANRTLAAIAYQASSDDGVRRGGAMTCQRISSLRAYVLHALPLENSAVEMPTRQLAMVLIIDPARHPLPVVQLLRQLYGLTKAEASVADLVLYGEGVKGISDRLSLSSATVRTHLRAIFGKTGTHRQAELVRLLSTIVP